MTGHIDVLTAARVEALFMSDLPASTTPGPEEISAAVRRAIHMYGGTRSCAAEVAAAFGDHPEIAVTRMRWALSAVRNASVRVRPSRRHPAGRCGEPPGLASVTDHSPSTDHDNVPV